MNPAAVRLCSAEELNLEKTLTCGQCFRWEKENTAWIGIAGAVPARLWEENGSVWLQSPDPGPWRDYFDLATDYRTLAHRIEEAGGYLRAAAAEGRGIRLLRQDPWETLCSFLLSQCNNIPRIRKFWKCSAAISAGRYAGRDGRTARFRSRRFSPRRRRRHWPRCAADTGRSICWMRRRKQPAAQ